MYWFSCWIGCVFMLFIFDTFLFYSFLIYLMELLVVAIWTVYWRQYEWISIFCIWLNVAFTGIFIKGAISLTVETTICNRTLDHWMTSFLYDSKYSSPFLWRSFLKTFMISLFLHRGVVIDPGLNPFRWELCSFLKNIRRWQSDSLNLHRFFILW